MIQKINSIKYSKCTKYAINYIKTNINGSSKCIVCNKNVSLFYDFFSTYFYLNVKNKERKKLRYKSK